MIWLVILVVILALIAVGQGLTIVAFMFAADAENQNPATVDLGDAYAIDSAGRAYEAVAVKPCGACGQEMPADHQCTGTAA